MREDPVLQVYGIDYQMTMARLVVLAVSSSNSNAHAAAQAGNDLLEAMTAKTSSVMGNRGPDATIRWCDLKLIMEGQLRLLLDYLENQE